MPNSITEWPNKLGYNITIGTEVHEAWKLWGGLLGIRTFIDGTPYRHLQVPGGTDLFEAVEIALERGSDCT